MNLVSFSENTKRLSDWFGKRLTESQLDLMFDRLKNVPGEAYVDIVGEYIDNSKPTPGNFPNPKDVLSKYWFWRKDHPEKVRAFEKQECSDCMGSGLLVVKYMDESVGYIVEAIVRCASCRNWMEHFHPKGPALIKFKSELESLGLEVLPDPEKYKRIIARRSSLAEMADKSSKTPDYSKDTVAHQDKVRKQADTILTDYHQGR